MSDDNGENEITDLDREIAEAIADGDEPNYEMSAVIRRGLESTILYMQVHDLSYICAQALVIANDHESYAADNGWLTPVVAQAIAEVRRLAWANADNAAMEATMASFNAIHEERMK